MQPAAQIDAADLHGFTVRSGDWLYADDDGIIVLAQRHTRLPAGG